MIIKKDIFLSYVTVKYIVICTRWYPFLCLNNIPHIHRKKDVFFSWILTCNALIKKTKEYLFYILKYYNIEFEHAND